MAELEQHAAQVPDYRGPAPAAAGEPAPDPIRGLHKMSTTAGATNQEYVAINNLAILAGFFGLASVLAVVFAAPFLLVLGVAGLIFGAIALYQIRDSNGTQGGTIIALAGILFSLAFAGAYVYQSYRTARIHREKVAQINAVIDLIGRHVIAGEYDKAHAIFDPTFQAQWPRERFAGQWKELLPFTGKLQSMRGNNVVQFESTREGDTAQTQAILDFENPQMRGSRQTMHFRQVNGQWQPIFFGLFDARQRQ
jgi:hypothetical protein